MTLFPSGIAEPSLTLYREADVAVRREGRRYLVVKNRRGETGHYLNTRQVLEMMRTRKVMVL